jgi:hypothetical protein
MPGINRNIHCLVRPDSHIGMEGSFEPEAVVLDCGCAYNPNVKVATATKILSRSAEPALSEGEGERSKLSAG